MEEFLPWMPLVLAAPQVPAAGQTLPLSRKRHAGLFRAPCACEQTGRGLVDAKAHQGFHDSCLQASSAAQLDAAWRQARSQQAGAGQ